MKKLLLLSAGVFCAAAAFAAPATIKNTMKMVAYFPVPYVAYDTVSASQSLDLGILDKCELSLGENKSNLGGSNCALFLHGEAAGTDDAQRGLLNVSSGKLDLNATGFNGVPLIKSNTVLVGTGGQPGYGWLDIGRPGGKSADFDALYVASITKAGNSLRATQEASVPEFKMFDEIANDFPDCGGTVTWQELELGADETQKKTYKDIYLVCDNAESGSGPCEPPDGEEAVAPCDPPATGTKTRTWDSQTCSWSPWSLLGCQLTAEPDEKVYYWELVAEKPLGTIKPSYGVHGTCAILVPSTLKDPFVSGGALKKELAAGVLGVPNPCSKANLGMNCSVGVVEVINPATMNASYYNPIYMCHVKP